MFTHFFALLCLLVPISLVAESTSGTVESISEEYGNLETSITLDDINSLDIQTSDQLLVMYGDQKITTYFGKTYEDVASGEWISFINWENKLRIARNHKNAAKALSAKIGDKLTISKISNHN
jgi:S-adenosylmethionine hydrolase